MPGRGHEGMGRNPALPESLPTEPEQAFLIRDGQTAKLGLPTDKFPIDPMSPSGAGFPKQGAVHPFLHEMVVPMEENLGTGRLLFPEPGQEIGFGDHGSVAMVEGNDHQGDAARPQGTQALPMAFNQGIIPGPDVMYG